MKQDDLLEEEEIKQTWFERSPLPLSSGVFWIRFWKYGIQFKDLTKVQKYYSDENYKYIRDQYCFQIKNWFFKTFKF